jgi:hypothetical protein
VFGSTGDFDLNLKGSGNKTIEGTFKGASILIGRSGGNMKLVHLQSDRSKMFFRVLEILKFPTVDKSNSIEAFINGYCNKEYRGNTQVTLRNYYW